MTDALYLYVVTLRDGKPKKRKYIKPLNAELNPISHLPTLLGAHHIFHVSGLRVK